MKRYFKPRRGNVDGAVWSVWTELERIAKQFGSNIVCSTLAALADATGYSEYYVKSAIDWLEEAGVLKACWIPGRGPSTFELLYDLGIYTGKVPREHEQVRNIMMKYYELERKHDDLLRRWKNSVLRKKKGDTELL